MGRVIRDPREARIPHEVMDARGRARAIIEAAEAKAQTLVADAEREVEAIRERAAEHGEQSGRAEAALLLKRAADAHDEIQRTSEAQLIRLAVGAAESLVRAQLAVAPETIRELVRGALEPARRAKRVVLKLAPEGAAVLRGDEAFEGIRIIDDETLQPGDCIVDTELGVMDGTLRVRVAALQEALR